MRWMELLPALHFVYLSRDDLLGQAISWTRALQIEQYRSTQRATGDAIYDGDLLRSRLVAIVRERSQWDAFFARTGTQPLRITDERFLEDGEGHVGRIRDTVGGARSVSDESGM